MTKQEATLTLDILNETINALDEQPVYSDTFYVDGLSFHVMPEAVKRRIKWAFDHIYISDNLVRGGNE